MQIPYIGSHRFQGFLISTLNLKKQVYYRHHIFLLAPKFYTEALGGRVAPVQKEGMGEGGVCEVVIGYP